MDRRRFIAGSISGVAGVRLASLPAAGIGIPAGANERIRIGIIGCGSRGQYLLDHVLRLAPSMNLEVAALCDVWKVNLDAAAAAVALRQERVPKRHARYLDLLEMTDVDAVMIATPESDVSHSTRTRSIAIISSGCAALRRRALE